MIDSTTLKTILAPVLHELDRATTKFPAWPTDPLHAVAIIGEELGELTQAALQCCYEEDKALPDDVRREAVQVAAMALRFLAGLERYEYREGKRE